MQIAFGSLEQSPASLDMLAQFFCSSASAVTTAAEKPEQIAARKAKFAWGAWLSGAKAVPKTDEEEAEQADAQVCWALGQVLSLPMLGHGMLHLGPASAAMKGDRANGWEADWVAQGTASQVASHCDICIRGRAQPYQPRRSFLAVAECLHVLPAHVRSRSGKGGACRVLHPVPALRLSSRWELPERAGTDGSDLKASRNFIIKHLQFVCTPNRPLFLHLAASLFVVDVVSCCLQPSAPAPQRKRQGRPPKAKAAEVQGEEAGTKDEAKEAVPGEGARPAKKPRGRPPLPKKAGEGAGAAADATVAAAAGAAAEMDEQAMVKAQGKGKGGKGRGRGKAKVDEQQEEGVVRKEEEEAEAQQEQEAMEEEAMEEVQEDQQEEEEDAKPAAGLSRKQRALSKLGLKGRR